MKTFTRKMLLPGIFITAFAFISWDLSVQFQTHNNYFSDDFLQDYTSYNAFLSDADNNFEKDITNRVPAAEDVLVEKISDDKTHLLVMAVYSLEQYAGKSFSINVNGSHFVFRDDGQEFDKVAGDGVFTTKVSADLDEFRKVVNNMEKEMKTGGKQPEFYNRMLITPENCSRGSYDAQLFENNQAVSIAGLTNGSNDLIDSVRRNCIFITNTNVVEDPSRTWNPCQQTGNIDGPWTFKTLMKNLAKTSASKDPSDAELSNFVLNWLKNFQVTRVVNQDSVPPRPIITQKLINPWLAKSKAAGAPTGQLDMRFAPFKLTSIVNRFDIRERAAGIPAGEGRFTFCLIDSSCTKALQMTIVMEFAVNKPDICDSLRDWAKQWYHLKDFTLGSTQYNAALQAITDQYAKWGTVNNNKRIGLDAIRTNEIEFAPETGTKRYEFREFGLSVTPSRKIFQRTVAQIPLDKYNAQVDNADVRLMVSWVNANRSGIINDDYNVPDTLPGKIPFLGGHSQILGNPVGQPPAVYHWDGVETAGPAKIKNTTARQVFSRNTCTGCHAGELQTFFTHVDPVFFGKEATLSGFLTGTAGRGGAIDFDNNPDNDSMMVKDAANRGGASNSLRMFNDILRRAKDLKDFVLTPPCATSGIFALRNELMFQPISAVH